MIALPSRSNRVTFWLPALSTFAIPHLIDHFQHNIPLEFGISVWSAQKLAGFFMFMLHGAGLLAASNKLSGCGLCAFPGAFLALAVLIYHVPRMQRPGSYWSGLLPEILIPCLPVTSIGLFATSIPVIRERTWESK